MTLNHRGVFAGIFAVAVVILGSTLGTFARIDSVVESIICAYLSCDATGQTVVIGIDDSTLAAYGGTPIERHHFATVLNRLNAAGARRVYIDAYFIADGNTEGDAQLEEAFRNLGPNRAALPVVLYQSGTSSRSSSLTQHSQDRFSRHLTKVCANMPIRNNGLVREIGLDRSSIPSAANWLATGSLEDLRATRV
ncbi:MAG: CHASE2 domain-containing protein, partial [Planctomycetaceae bacterium]|nr:CHASE2 domain-containing protein [Planctomycetaceae bacterium]